MLLKEYTLIIDQCFDCGSKNMKVMPYKQKILNTTVVDYPNIVCQNCGTEWLSGEFTEPLTSVLLQYHIYPKEMSIEEIKQLDKDNLIKFI